MKVSVVFCESASYELDIFELLTFSFFYALDVGAELVDGLNVLVFLFTVEYDTTTCMSARPMRQKP